MAASVAKKIVFLVFFLLFGCIFSKPVFATTYNVCGTCEYTSIQEAVDASDEGDTIFVEAGTYNERVIINHQLYLETAGPDQIVYVTKLDLQSSVTQVRPGTFIADYVVVRARTSASPVEAIGFVKDGGTVDIENKSKDETCLENHWEGGITIDKSLTLESNSLNLGEEACFTNNSGTAITVTGGEVTLKNIILYGSVNGLKVDGGKVTIVDGSISHNTHGIVTALGTEVKATHLYWGAASGPYNALHNPQGLGNDVGNEVVFCPFYTDEAKTNLDDRLCRSSSNSNNNSSSPGNPGPPACNDSKPSSIPNLFQVDTTKTTAKLFFTPVNNNISYYYIAYGFWEGDERFGVSFDKGYYNGVIDYTINKLSPNTTYYFKVRAGNGCATGDWSNWRAAKTKPNYYLNNSLNNLNKRSLNTPQKQKTNQIQKIEPTTVNETITTELNPPQDKNNNLPEIKKFWWQKIFDFFLNFLKR